MKTTLLVLIFFGKRYDKEAARIWAEMEAFPLPLILSLGTTGLRVHCGKNKILPIF